MLLSPLVHDMQLLIQTQTLALTFENWKVISSHFSAGMLSIIHAGLIQMSKNGPIYARDQRFYTDWSFNTEKNGRHFPDDILKLIFFNEMYESLSKFHWSLFLGVQLTIFHHWFR